MNCPYVSKFSLVSTGDGRADAMTIEKRGDNPAVEEVPRSSSRILKARSPLGYGDLTIAVALELQTLRVVCPAAPAIVADHLILERLACH